MMIKHSDPQIILAIETALAGGSLALYRDGDVYADVRGVSRSEDVLPAINALLQKVELGIRDVKEIAVSLGPGSFTGIRIGIATALGLKASLGVPCFGIMTTAAVGSTLADIDRYAVVPVGRGQYSVQYFQAGKIDSNEPSKFWVVNKSELCRMTIEYSKTTFVFAHEFSDLDRSTPTVDLSNAIISGKPIANLMCHLLVNGHKGSGMTPIYARPETNQVR